MKALKYGLLAYLLAALPALGHEPKLEHRFADVNGVRLHFVSAGAGKLIVFLHGFPHFWYQWHPQLAEFSKDHHVVAPDMRGYNLSSKPSARAVSHRVSRRGYSRPCRASRTRSNSCWSAMIGGA